MQNNQQDEFQSKKGIKSIPMTQDDDDEEDDAEKKQEPAEEKVAEPKKDKKKKKKKNKKGLADFMDDNKEQNEFKKDALVEEVSSTPVEQPEAPSDEVAPTVASVAEPPAEATQDDEDIDDEQQTTPVKSKTQSILMKDDETSEKKSGVKFDESKNSVVEFLKHEKLKKDKHYKKPIKFENDDLEQPLKRQQTPRAPLDENINTANISEKAEAKKEEKEESNVKQKIQIDEEQI